MHFASSTSFVALVSVPLFRPASPDVAGVAIVLQPDFITSHAVSLTLAPSSQQIINRWTHVALMPLDTDVRDGYVARANASRVV